MNLHTRNKSAGASVVSKSMAPRATEPLDTSLFNLDAAVTMSDSRGAPLTPTDKMALTQSKDNVMLTQRNRQLNLHSSSIVEDNLLYKPIYKLNSNKAYTQDEWVTILMNSI